MLAMSPFAPSLLDAMMVEHLRAKPRVALSGNVPRLSEQDENTYALTILAPGVASSDLTVGVEDGVIKVDGETAKSGLMHIVHWKTRLPSDAAADQATVTCRDGVVEISIPKKVAAEPTVIAVKRTFEEVAATADDQDENAKSEPKQYTLTITAPGLSASDLELVATDGVLKVTGKSQRTGAHLAKSFRLPRDADATSASATHVDGILTIAIPKAPEYLAAKKMLIVKDSEGVQDDVDEAPDEAPEMV